MKFAHLSFSNRIWSKMRGRNEISRRRFWFELISWKIVTGELNLFSCKNLKTSDWSAFHELIKCISFLSISWTHRLRNIYFLSFTFSKYFWNIFYKMMALKESKSPRQRNVHAVCRMTKRRCGRLQVRIFSFHDMGLIQTLSESVRNLKIFMVIL